MSTGAETKRRQRRPVDSMLATEKTVAQEVPANRTEEIRRYLELFGYKPHRSILQAHVAGSFGQRSQSPKELDRRAKAQTKYGGRTFTVLGRTHDPSFVQRLIPPRPKRDSQNPGYLGYLFMEKDRDRKPPHELLPLDFTPASLQYPGEWKNRFGTKGVLVAMHVPADYAAKKNEIHRRLRRISGAVDPRKRWEFLDELEEYGYHSVSR